MNSIDKNQDLRERLNKKRQSSKHEQVESIVDSVGMEAKLEKLKRRIDALEVPLPPKFKIPQIKLYRGEGNPAEYLETYRSWMEL